MHEQGWLLDNILLPFGDVLLSEIQNIATKYIKTTEIRNNDFVLKMWSHFDSKLSSIVVWEENKEKHFEVQIDNFRILIVHATKTSGRVFYSFTHSCKHTVLKKAGFKRFAFRSLQHVFRAASSHQTITSRTGNNKFLLIAYNFIFSTKLLLDQKGAVSQI